MAKLSELDRFLSHVEKTDSCWLWTAFKMKNGYGKFRMPTHGELAHRASYRLFKEAIPDGMDVMHSCDNPACVNPAHLSVGTRSDNMQDASKKLRIRHGDRHPWTRLSPELIRHARDSDKPQKQLAEELGISQSYISQLKAGIRRPTVN